MITISLDVTLLDKTRFKEVTRRNGKKAVFADIILIETPNSEYGDYMVKQSVTREESAAKKEMPILGSGKIRGSQARQAAPAPTQASDAPADDVPF